MSPLPTLQDVFQSLPSERKPRGTRYPTGAVFALVFIALLSGCKNYSQIAVFAGTLSQSFRKQLGFYSAKYPRKKENRDRVASPNEDTLASVVGSVRTADFNLALAQFFSRLVRRGAQAAIDGKALRGADEYVLSVFVNEISQVVWQEDVGRDKENECSCLQRSLSLIFEKYPQLALLTGDAAFCHKTITRAIIEAKRDYWLQLKASHGTDLALAEDAFSQLRHTEPLATTVEKKGARAGRRS